ncbi:MAG: tetraacyldisaccharide 4'-kinase [Epsilonproteobacteria bacterium]|nr:tetraacyldisaccharide 4'-kinase [Campylobacterota bacterium]
MKKHLVFWVEEYFYNPTLSQKIISLLLLPLSWLYCFVMYMRFRFSHAEDMGVKIIGIGNLTVGGSGKTPLVCALANRYDDVAVILRGYGRASQGLLVVKDGVDILCDVTQSGDEAMIYAHKVDKAIVIVSEDRKRAVQKAKEMGVKIIFLDDAYSKHSIKKLDLLIEAKSENSSCLPSGPFRERLWSTKEAIRVREGEDFKRVVQLKNKSDKMSLVTAIARPQRLDSFLPDVVAKHYFEDHHAFDKDELQSILKSDGAASLLVTYKDYVKIEPFGIEVSLLDLEVDVNENIFKIIDDYRG